jgi:hypothetical protein
VSKLGATMLRAAMPKASVNEDGNTPTRKDYIGTPPQADKRLRGHTVSIA